MPSSDPNKCVSKGFGIQHPYSYCIKPSEKMVGPMVTSNPLSMTNTGNVLSGLMNYVEYLTLDATPGTADECLNNHSAGLIGNRYILKTDIKCRVVDPVTGTISGEAYLHKYMNNADTIGGILTGGRPQNDVNGLIPSTFASAGKIGGSVGNIMTSFTGSTNPLCMAVRLDCHVIDSKNDANSYKGTSPFVHLSLDDIEDIDVALFTGSEKKPQIPPTISYESFTNLNIFNNNYINENIIYQNMDKIQGASDFESALNVVNFQDEFLVKSYYIGFSIFIIIIIFKLLNKK